MEVRINREIREYTESVFFGLSLRQFFFSAMACVVAVGTYFLLRPVLGLEAVSWICILAAFPFAMIGFSEVQRDERRKVHCSMGEVGDPDAKASDIRQTPICTAGS